MKRFLLFAYRDYYPAGGIEDVESEFDTPSEAMTRCHELRVIGPESKLYGMDNLYVWDRIEAVKILDLSIPDQP